jgi:hypothetical protein
VYQWYAVPFVFGYGGCYVLITVGWISN